MSEIGHAPGPYGRLMQATTVVLLFQAVFVIAQVLDDAPYSSSMTAILAATLAQLAVSRRLAGDSQRHRARGYVMAWRYGVLVLLGMLTVVVAVRAYAPEATPRETPTLIAMLLSAVLALKGALLGKLKPGLLGLRLPWTCRSRLAWEKAHRLMGRVLFFGGLIGLVSAPFVPFFATVIGLAALVATGVAAGAIESWRVWRNDPERRP